MPTKMSGNALLDVRVKEPGNGCLDVFVSTTGGTFKLDHRGFAPVPDASAHRCSSWLPLALPGTEINSVWTDDETLFLLIGGDAVLEYGFDLANSIGSVECVRFITNPDELAQVTAYCRSEGRSVEDAG